MKFFSHFSKALTVGTLAAVLLVASTGNQVALGAASTTTATIATKASASQEMWWAAITGDFVQGIVDGLQRSQQFSEQNSLVAMQHYQSTDFAQFD